LLKTFGQFWKDFCASLIHNISNRALGWDNSWVRAGNN